MLKNFTRNEKILIYAVVAGVLVLCYYFFLSDPLNVVGYNFFFFLDNLLYIRSADPILLWILLGTLLGFILGTYFAIKKFRLKNSVLLYPIIIFVLILGSMGLINRPLDYRGSLDIPINDEKEIPKQYYRSMHELNVREGPSTGYPILFVINGGAEVELIEKGHFASNRQEWFKIRFEGKEGFVNGRFLEFSRSSSEGKTSGKDNPE